MSHNWSETEHLLAKRLFARTHVWGPMEWQRPCASFFREGPLLIYLFFSFFFPTCSNSAKLMAQSVKRTKGIPRCFWGTHGCDTPWGLLLSALSLCQGWNVTKPSWRCFSQCQWECLTASFYPVFVCLFVWFGLVHPLKCESYFYRFDLVLKSFEKHSLFRYIAFCERDQLPESVLLLSGKSSISKSVLWHGDF